MNEINSTKETATEETVTEETVTEETVTEETVTEETAAKGNEDNKEIATEILEKNNTYTAVVNVYQLNIREKASIQSKILDVLNIGTQVKISDETDEFGKLADRDGWIMLGYTQKI